MNIKTSNYNTESHFHYKSKLLINLNSNITDHENYDKKIENRRKSKFDKILIPLESYVDKFEKENEEKLKNPEIEGEEFTPEEKEMIEEILEDINSFDFNIFDFNELVSIRCLELMSYRIFNQLSLFQKIDENIFLNFIRKITKGYKRNITYHNDLHASDVMQTFYTILDKGGLIDKLELSDNDTISLIIACACHDYKHPGLNNSFQVNTLSKIALKYNDTSVLENYHCAQTFKVLQKQKYNIFIEFKPEEKRIMRRRIIESILFTDMAYHAKNLSLLKGLALKYKIKKGKNIEKLVENSNVSITFENQQLLLGMIVHASDISNPCKPSNIQKMWVDLLMIEFFNQGELELENKIPVSLFCDREKINIKKSQICFASLIVIPTFDAICNIIPEAEKYLKTAKKTLEKIEEEIRMKY